MQSRIDHTPLVSALKLRVNAKTPALFHLQDNEQIKSLFHATIISIKSSMDMNRSMKNPYYLPTQVTFGSNSLKSLGPKVHGIASLMS